MIVTLIGYRGCGKSSVGPLLAARLQCRCVDSDDEIESSSGKTIGEIFADDGESTFRALETEVLTQLLNKPPVVIAAGGGAILAPVNRELMKEAGPVVWLTASVATLASRIGRDGTSQRRRPSLTGKSIDDEVADVLEARLPLYKDAATITIDAESESPLQIADRIVAALGDSPAGGTP
ncbi:MAG: shikimate kinase [Fuerstiella sp.]|nr:shikimate kinase [Fuerstiella sp.]MCP4858824.1 shikimate kinase [Fuerstiella sp.]